MSSTPLGPEHKCLYLEDIGHHGATVEALIVSHPHTDHFRGAETISRHFSVDHYYDPGYPSTLVSYNSFMEVMRGSAEQPGRANHVHLGLNQFGGLNWGAMNSRWKCYMRGRVRLTVLEVATRR